MTLFPVIDDLDPIELQAARLDGECYLLADRSVPIGIRPSPAVRATAAVGGRADRLVAALATAAWVWGAMTAPPGRLEFAVDREERWRPQPGDRVAVMETVLRPGDVVRFGRAGVTSPLRTAVDLARFRDVFGPVERDIVRTLAVRGGFTAADAEQAMARGRNLAGKLRATERIRDALSRS